jgi:hypothetical protein
MTRYDTSTTVPAGWYPDPQGPPLQRWWDGAVWTQHTNDPRPVASPLPTALEEQVPAYVPMQGFESKTTTRPVSYGAPTRTSALNVWVWLLAGMPLIQGVVGLVVLLAIKELPGGVVRYALLIGPLAAYLFLAKKDGATSRDRGHASVGWGWILLPLVYFVLRTVRTGRGSLAPLFTWVGLQVAFMMVAAAVAIPIFMQWQAQENPEVYGSGSSENVDAAVPKLTPEQRAYQLTAEGMSARLLSDFQKAQPDIMTYAQCAEPTSLVQGTEVLCSTDYNGAPVVIRVELQPDDPYTPFYVTGVVN